MAFKQLKYTKFMNKVPGQFRDLNCEAFNLTLPYEAGDGPTCLIVVGHVHTHDLEAGRLLSASEDRKAISTVLDLSRKWAGKFMDGEKPKNFKYHFINFNYHKNYHLSGEHFADSNRSAAKRVRKFIAELKPDIILIMGDSASRHLLKADPINHGLVYKIEVEGKEYTAVPTVELATLTVDQAMPNGEKYELGKTNLMMYAVRTISTVFKGKPCISLSGVKPNPVNIESIKDFKKLMKKLWEAPAVAIDTETTGLTVLNDELLTIQFAVDSKVGYVVPIKHKDCPFNAAELTYVMDELRKFLGRRRLPHIKWEEQPYFIKHNGKFDLRVLRFAFNVPCIQTPVWDTLSGEFILDENMIDLRMHTDLKGAWGLEIVAARYNNTWYQQAAFGKAHRTTIKDVSLDAGVLDYCAMDVQLPFAIHRAQQKVAQAMEHEGGTYLHDYRRMQLAQMSNMVHQLSSMKLRGMPLDPNYLMLLRSKSSPLAKMIKEAEKKLREFPTVKKANKRLLGDRGAPSRGLFGEVSSWVFDLGKSGHKQMLYIDILGLKPVNYGKDGETPAIDKTFQEAYKDVPEVQVLTERSKIKKLDDSYAKGMWNQVKNDVDYKVDQRIRPEFGYLLVTGRTNCTSPNLQQIPEHGKLAPIIKRLFIAPPGTIRVKFDFSVHEVRGWGIVALDDVLLSTFDRINALVLAFRKKKKPTKEDKEEVETKGDMHKLNYSAFTGVKVEDVTKEQRQGAKGITFGSIYGQSVKALGEVLKVTTKQAQELTDRFFAKFNKAKKWLDKVADQAVSRGYVVSMLGRRRNLWGGVLGYSRLEGAIRRRAQNSPIQGMSSDIAISAARLLEEAIYEFMQDMDELPEGGCMQPSIGVCAMVHDSTEGECYYRHFFVLLWMMEYFAIHGIRKYIKEVFEVDTKVDFAIEFAVGTLGSEMRKWDWTQDCLHEIIVAAVKDQRDVLGHEVDVDKTVRTIYKYGKKYAPELRKRYPLPVEPDMDYLDNLSDEKPKKKKKSKD